MNAALPKSVQRELDAADALVAQMAAPAQPEAQPPVQTEPSPVVQEPVVQPPEAPAPQPELAELRQSLRTLQGKYDAEVPRLHELLRAASRQRELLVVENQELKAKVETLSKAPAAPVSVVTNEDIDEFGEDMVAFVRRVAGAEVAGVKPAIMSEIEPIRQKVATVAETVQVSAEDKYWEAVYRAVPDLDTVNTDQRWLTWLAQVDPLVGHKRQDLLDNAVSSMNLARTLAIVGAWKESLGPAAAPRPNELESQVTPTRSAAGSDAGVQTAKIWTQAEYNAVFDPRRTARMDPKEVARAQAEADRAAAEGRVQWM